MKPNTKTSSKNINGAQRPIDVYFALYNQQYPSVREKVILSVILLVLYFGLMGLIWIIPFPHPGWMGSYNGYFNWASFYIATMGFYWYKQSPVLSYFLFILLFAFSYGASQLAEMGALVGPPVWTICVPIVVAALVTFYMVTKKRNGVAFVSSMLRMPIWLVSFLGKKLGARF